MNDYSIDTWPNGDPAPAPKVNPANPDMPAAVSPAFPNAARGLARPKKGEPGVSISRT